MPVTTSMANRVLWSWLRLCCLAHLLLFFCSNGGIPAASAEETTDFEQEQNDAMAQSKSRMPQNVADDNFNELQWLPEPLKEMNLVKRAPMGFTGVRGKKKVRSNPLANAWQQNTPNNAIDDRWKKAQAAFYGVRGKKYDDYDGNVLPYELKLQQHQNQQQDERDAILQEFIDRWAEASLLQENSVGKRAPIGFTGMRGKRYYDDDNEKRTLNNAFMGVRGKKDNENHQFYKRSLSFNQPDVVGRRRFSDFTNKFVAVRGKKDFLNSRERYFANMWPVLDLEKESSNDKRAPFGFVGMRGIKNKPIGHHV